jgi:hypothetical protein
MPDPRAVADPLDEVLLAAGVTVPAAAPTSSVRRHEPRARRPDPPAAGADSPARPPPTAPAVVRPLVVSAAVPAVLEPVRHVARRVAARAGPGRRDGSPASTLPAGTGPAIGAVTALGTVASLLLGIWIAVLVTACLIVLPRIRHRRWTGPIWRLTRLPSSRLERPG